MKITIDGVEVINIREAAQRANVSTQYIYKVLNDESSGLVVKTNDRMKFVTVQSFENWLQERNE